MRNYFIVILLLTNAMSFSQQENEISNSDYKKLQARARLNINNSVDSSFYYANKIEKSSNNIHKAFAKGIKSYLYQKKNDTIQSNKNYVLANEFINKSSDSYEKTRTKALILNYKGLTEWKRKNFSEALKSYFKAKELANLINEKALVITLNTNIALLYADTGDFDNAIKITKQSNKFIDKNSLLYDDESLKLNKSLINLNIGNYFFKKYVEDTKFIEFLDSSEVYFQKCIVFSKKIHENKFIAQRNLASIYHFKGKYDKAELLLVSALSISKDKKFENEYFDIIYNIGDLYYYKKDYLKALIYFKKTDSIYLRSKISPINYIKSNYFQAKIYDSIGDNKKALYHSKIYLNNFEKNEFKENNEIAKVNFLRNNENVKEEISKIITQSERKILFRNIILVISILFALIIVYFLWRNIKIKNKTQLLFDEFKSNNVKLTDFNVADLKKLIKPSAISISEEKEKELLEKLKDLEKKNYFLRQDFSQAFVSKKLKTNTTYISVIVNKYYDKTFSEYSNELKINYAINEMLNNPTYRKYSTQAIAESVGFKNNVSFTKSFNKRTGLTPAQFIKNIEDKINL